MDELFLGCLAFVAAAIVFALSVVLPIVAAVRASRALRLVRSLRDQVAALEARLATLAQPLSSAGERAESGASLAASPPGGGAAAPIPPS